MPGVERGASLVIEGSDTFFADTFRETIVSKGTSSPFLAGFAKNGEEAG